MRRRCATSSVVHMRLPIPQPLTPVQMLERFLRTKSRASQLGAANPLEEGAESSAKASRALSYKDKRDQADRDTTSRLR